jgi:hypothetical protein
MNFDSVMLVQLGILVFGCSSIWILGRPESWRRFGYLLGLLSQPFWLYMSIKTGQWGVFILSLFYAYSWAQGVWFHLVRPDKVEPEDPTEVPNREPSITKRLGQPSGAFKGQ